MAYKGRFSSSLVLVALAITTVGCQQETQGETSAQSVPSLPITLNEMMVGEVDLAADVLWAVGNGDTPKNDRDWHQVRNHAYQLVVAGAAIQLPTTGTFDAEWKTDPQWREYADDLTAIGQDAVALAEAREATEGWFELGSRLVDNCEGCHAVFKPDIPSQGVFHEPFDPDRAEASIFD